MEWSPFDEPALSSLMAEEESALTPAARALWNLIRVRPVKWQFHPWGDPCGGFWVVGIIGELVIWYNEIEDGFNLSRYDVPGVIADYWCNQDELQHTICGLLRLLETGEWPVRLGPPQPIP
jgi:hypothetical protein